MKNFNSLYVERHTLNDYLSFYKNIEKIHLTIAEHEILIDCNKAGSNFMVRAFEDKKFYFVDIYEGTLLLDINDPDEQE